MKYIPRLKKKYNKEIINNLQKNYKSVMQVPKLLKICLNQGVNAVTDKKQIEAAQKEMTIITGQKAVLTKSKKDISNFKLRKGMPVGVMVTLRSDRMYEFLDRFVTSTLPRVRDFQGLEVKGFDGRGNFTMGIKEQIAFPEISIDKISKITGMDITFVTDTNSNEDALILLKEFGLPFKDETSRKDERKAQIKQKDQEERRQLEEEVKQEMLGEVSEEDISSQDSEEISKDNQDDSLESEKDNNQDLSEETDKSESL